MIKSKTWKQRLFASVVAVCMIFTLLPATAMATGEETPAAPLVKNVWIGNDNPSSMQGSENAAELAGYKANMEKVQKVVYSKNAKTITVVADVEGMNAYMENLATAEAGNLDLKKQKLYTLVMDFGSDKESVQATTDGGGQYLINNEIDKPDGGKFLPAGASADGPVVFWLDAARATTKVVLKDGESGTPETYTVNVVSSAALVKDVWEGNDNPSTMQGSENAAELAGYKANMAQIKGVEYVPETGVITVTADVDKMTNYMFDKIAEGAGNAYLRTQKLYTLVMDFIADVNTISATGSYLIDEDGGDKSTAGEFLTEKSETAKNPIVFWLNAAKSETKFTLKNGDGDDAISQEITVKVVAPTEEPENPVVSPTVTTVEAVKVNKAKTELTVGGTEKLTATVTVSPADAEASVTWDSSNKAVATVAADGTVTAKAVGTANITATAKIGDSEKSDVCAVTVKAKEEPTTQKPTTAKKATVTLNAKTLTMKKGTSTKALAVKKASVKGDKIKSVKSSNSKVVAASVKGGKTITLKAKKNGKATITVTMKSGAKATVKVTVNNKKVVTKKITLSQKKATLKAKKSVKLTVTRNPINATEKITWTSSNKKVATVKNGKVVAKKKGKATITAKTANGKKATCKITVK